jgi:tRNA-specific 2-thiouridylase
MPGPTVLVAMSGGVDSSVAACLLHEQGFRVVGTHLKLVHGDGMDHGCCGPAAEADAAEVARVAGFPFEVVDLSQEFERTVVPDYVDEHRAGRTPNPCVRCNQWIKFGALLDRTERLGVDLVATGHYVRSWQDGGGGWHLGPGADPGKDQSYLLHTLGQRELARSTFPVGGLPKAETRAHAVRLGLPVAGKPDSQDLCFAPAADHGAFLVERAPDLARPGQVVDAAGRVLGAHEGTFRFTVGQRRGLGVSTGERLFVLETDPSAARVVVGPAELLARRSLRASDVRWVAGEPPAGPVEAEVRIRYRGAAIPAVVAPEGGDRLVVEFRRPERGVAPGQSVVVYADGEVLGGGRIDAAA